MKVEAQAKDLVANFRENWKQGCRSPQYDRFCKTYLTDKGEAIAETAESHMSDRKLLAIAFRAVKAGY